MYFKKKGGDWGAEYAGTHSKNTYYWPHEVVACRKKIKGKGKGLKKTIWGGEP